ncbi:MAG: hypothetical protein AAF721_28680 [Myxococcota bacterium]
MNLLSAPPAPLSFATALVAAAALLVGCPSDDPVDPAGDDAADGTDGADDGGGTTVAEPGTTGEQLDPNAPKYYDDILPLFIENCSSCHVEGGLGPFDLEDYETAKGLAEAIVASTESRSMPPFNADNSGECHTYANARWLEDDEIELVAQWLEGGTQEGDPNAVQPDRPEFESLRGENILELSTPEGYLPVADQSGPQDDYQCFLGQLNDGDAPIYIQGYEVIPGNPAVTHHMVGFLVNLEGPSAAVGTNAGLIELLDDASEQPGWDCFGAAGQGVAVEGTPVTWAPGGGAFNFPEGTGIRIDPGYALVMQTHYNLVNGTGEDTTKVRLSIADEVEREAVNALFDRFLFTGFSGGAAEIPPNTESYIYTWNEQIRNFDDRIAQWDKVEIFGALPHMHELGRRMQVRYLEGGTDASCGMYVDRWDFAWQQAFMYENPVVLNPNDTIEVTCEWNSMGKDSATQPGLGTQQEMCLFGIYAAEGS